jgi:hypothetical protein
MELLNALQSPAISYFFGLNIPLRTLFTHTHTPFVCVLPLMLETKYYAHTKLRAKYEVYYILTIAFPEGTNNKLRERTIPTERPPLVDEI